MKPQYPELNRLLKNSNAKKLQMKLCLRDYLPIIENLIISKRILKINCNLASGPYRLTFSFCLTFLLHISFVRK